MRGNHGRQGSQAMTKSAQNVSQKECKRKQEILPKPKEYDDSGLLVNALLLSKCSGLVPPWCGTTVQGALTSVFPEADKIRWSHRPQKTTEHPAA